MPNVRIVDTPLPEELSEGFLSYALSVIKSRALPDVRDGLKPVHRRIIYSMWRQKILPSGPHKKSARVVGDTMGSFHPHGDSAIYETLVRLSQPWALNLPLVDGHGNFGSLDDGPAASRYTECRLSGEGVEMLDGLSENTVDFAPTYDQSDEEPTVLPSSFPNLVVNGSSGIAVGMATSIPPHNLREVVDAVKLILANPQASDEDIVAFVPGPDFPEGGEVVNPENLAEAYRTGKGTLRLRATATIDSSIPRNTTITFTELPYMVGPERVIAKVRTLVTSKRLEGIRNISDLSDRTSGVRLVVDVKSGANPEAVLAELYRTTQLEDTVPISCVVLDNGLPVVLGLADLLRRYADHRVDVVTRRSQFRLDKATARAHILEGLSIALASIDEVVASIRRSRTQATAASNLQREFHLSEVQARHILDMPLRRLVAIERKSVTDELAELRKTIAALGSLLSSSTSLRGTVSDELETFTVAHQWTRRTRLGASFDVEAVNSLDVRLPDSPCVVGLTGDGHLSRSDIAIGRGKHRMSDVFVSEVVARTQGSVGVLTDDGMLHRVDVDLLGESRDAVRLGVPGVPMGLVDLDLPCPIVLGTVLGKVKRVAAGSLAKSFPQSIIRLEDGDRLVGVGPADDDSQVAFVTTAGMCLVTPAASIRPQGRSGSGVAGVRLDAGASVLWSGPVPTGDDVDLWVVSDSGGVKRSDMSTFPAKGRGTGGVRCVRFRPDEALLVAAWVGVDVMALAGTAVFRVSVERARRDATTTLVDVTPRGFGSPRR